jgi:pantothenate kinase-related protein Tda10
MNEDTVELFIQLLSALSQSSLDFRLRVKVLDRIAHEHPEALPDYDKFLKEGQENRGTKQIHDGIVEVLDKLRQALRRE